MTHFGDDKIPYICGLFKFYPKLVENTKIQLFFIFINGILFLLIFIP